MILRDKHIRQIAKGDVEQFKMFYEIFFQPLCVFSYSILKNENEAEDLVQDLLLIYWNKKADFETVDSARAFLYTIAKNKCLNIIRDKKIHQKYFDYILNNEEVFFMNKVIENETYTILHQAINELPAQTKKIIRLSLSGLRNQEIADRLNISVNTVKTLKNHGYTALRTKLSDNLHALIFLSILMNQKNRLWRTTKTPEEYLDS
ncbi:RNA polymerase sigma-70 factor [Mariniphaga sediminis]|nr:RNA polymerase sigma-70 factor [Mariniphaga sediminis]